MIFNILDIIYILLTVYLFLVPFTIYEYKLDLEKDRKDLEKDRKDLEDIRKDLEKDRKDLEDIRKVLDNDYKKLEIDRNRFAKNIRDFNNRLYNNNKGDISMWSDEDDWSDNIEDIDTDDFYNLNGGITLPRLYNKR